jgi:hypothetical protein
LKAAGPERHFPERRESFHGGFGEAIHGFHDPENASPVRPSCYVSRSLLRNSFVENRGWPNFADSVLIKAAEGAAFSQAFDLV